MSFGHFVLSGLSFIVFFFVLGASHLACSNDESWVRFCDLPTLVMLWLMVVWVMFLDLFAWGIWHLVCPSGFCYSGFHHSRFQGSSIANSIIVGFVLPLRALVICYSRFQGSTIVGFHCSESCSAIASSTEAGLGHSLQRVLWLCHSDFHHSDLANHTCPASQSRE